MYVFLPKIVKAGNIPQEIFRRKKVEIH